MTLEEKKKLKDAVKSAQKEIRQLSFLAKSVVPQDFRLHQAVLLVRQSLYNVMIALGPHGVSLITPASEREE